MFKPDFKNQDLASFIQKYTKDFAEEEFQNKGSYYMGNTNSLAKIPEKKPLKSHLSKTLNYSNELKYSLLKKKNPRTTITNLNTYISKIKKNSQTAMRRKSQIYSLKTSVFNIIDVKVNVMNSLMRRDKFSSVEKLYDIIERGIYLNDKVMLVEGINLIAELNLMFGDISSALFTFNHMRIVCDGLGMNTYKVRAMIMMANSCKRVRKFREAKIFLKKALQYVWRFNLIDLECTIYDYFGVIYYYLGNLEMAQYFHDRGVNFETESLQSPSKKFSEDNLKKFDLEYSLNNRTFKDINKGFLHKYVISLPFQSIDTFDQTNSDELLRKQDLRRSNCHYETELSIETLMDSILSAPEFSFEIGTPLQRKKDEFDPKNLKMNLKMIEISGKKGYSKRNFSDSQVSQENITLSQLNKFKTLKSKLANMTKETPRLPAALKKLPIDIILTERKKEMDEMNKRSLKNQASKSISTMQNIKNLKPQSYIIQLSRNRNIEQFENSCNVNINMIERRFDKLIQYFSKKVAGDKV